MADIREARASASELKFLIDRDRAEAVRRWARAHLEPDPHGRGPDRDEYRTTSLYFDTPRHDVLERRGSFGRAKYRVRRYMGGDQVFLERKLRRPGLVIKRRTLAPVALLTHLAQPQPNGPWPGDWFHRRILARGLAPVCQITYQRTARIADQGAARLTLDDAIQVERIDGPRFGEGPVTPVLPDRLVLELKFRGQAPVLFKQLLEEFALVSHAISKYRLGMSALGHVSSEEALP